MGSIVAPNKSFALTPPEPKTPTPLEMMSQLLQTQNPKDAVEVVKELAKLQMSMQDRDAEIDFNLAMASAQAEMKMVINDSDPEASKKAPGGKRWATYRALNKAARPIWMRYGLGVSYTSQPTDNPDQMLVMAHVSKGLHTRTYSIPMDISGKGPKGDGAMSKPHAIGAGLEYARRDLIRMIFDLITGEEEYVTNGEVMQAVEKIMDAGDREMVMHYYKEAYKQYESDPNAIKVVLEAKNKRMKEIQQKGAA